jgi:hypothetical protein
MENLDVLAALQLAEQQGLRALVRFVAWRTEKHFRLLAARVDVARTPDNILPQHAWDYPGGVQTGATIASPLDLRGLIRTPLGRPAPVDPPVSASPSWSMRAGLPPASCARRSSQNEGAGKALAMD